MAPTSNLIESPIGVAPKLRSTKLRTILLEYTVTHDFVAPTADLGSIG